MSTSYTAADLKKKEEELLQLLTMIALEGERCPSYGELRHKGFPVQTARSLTELARQGKIKIDIYPGNWRVVTICEGEHAGTHTKLPSHDSAPRRTIDMEGDTQSFKVSSAPVTLTAPPWEKEMT